MHEHYKYWQYKFYKNIDLKNGFVKSFEILPFSVLVRISQEDQKAEER